MFLRYLQGVIKTWNSEEDFETINKQLKQNKRKSLNKYKWKKIRVINMSTDEWLFIRTHIKSKERLPSHMFSGTL